MSEEKITVIVSNNCPACSTVLYLVEDDVKKGKVNVVLIDTDEGKKLAEELNIREVPAFIIEKKGRKVVCDVTYNGDQVLVDCPNDV